MTILARSAVSFAVPFTGPDGDDDPPGAAEARMPTYTLDARNRGFRTSGRFTLNALSVVSLGSTSAVTPNAGVPAYTLFATESKYTWKVTVPVSVSFSNEIVPLNRTVSTMDDDPTPMELIVCTGIVSGMPGGSGPR